MAVITAALAKEIVRETETIKETPDITNDEVSDDTEVSN